MELLQAHACARIGPKRHGKLKEGFLCEFIKICKKEIRMSTSYVEQSLVYVKSEYLMNYGL